MYYCSDIKICGEGGGAGGRAADQRGAGAAAAARHLGLQRGDSKICSTDWNRLRVCRSALVETWPMLGLNHKQEYNLNLLNRRRCSLLLTLLWSTFLGLRLLLPISGCFKVLPTVGTLILPVKVTSLVLFHIINSFKSFVTYVAQR